MLRRFAIVAVFVLAFLSAFRLLFFDVPLLTGMVFMSEIDPNHPGRTRGVTVSPPLFFAEVVVLIGSVAGLITFRRRD